jgi:hypothetical protein
MKPRSSRQARSVFLLSPGVQLGRGAVRRGRSRSRRRSRAGSAPNCRSCRSTPLPRRVLLLRLGRSFRRRRQGLVLGGRCSLRQQERSVWARSRLAVLPWLARSTQAELVPPLSLPRGELGAARLRRSELYRSARPHGGSCWTRLDGGSRSGSPARASRPSRLPPSAAQAPSVRVAGVAANSGREARAGGGGQRKLAWVQQGC